MYFFIGQGSIAKSLNLKYRDRIAHEFVGILSIATKIGQKLLQDFELAIRCSNASLFIIPAPVGEGQDAGDLSEYLPKCLHV